MWDFVIWGCAIAGCHYRWLLEAFSNTYYFCMCVGMIVSYLRPCAAIICSIGCLFWAVVCCCCRRVWWVMRIEVVAPGRLPRRRHWRPRSVETWIDKSRWEFVRRLLPRWSNPTQKSRWSNSCASPRRRQLPLFCRARVESNLLYTASSAWGVAKYVRWTSVHYGFKVFEIDVIIQ